MLRTLYVGKEWEQRTWSVWLPIYCGGGVVVVVVVVSLFASGAGVVVLVVVSVCFTLWCLDLVVELVV